MEAANQQYDGIEVYQPERLARETPTRFPDHALPEVASHPGLSGKSAEKRRPRNLQLDVKTMIILFLVAVIVIGSIIGGVLGSRAAKASPDPSPPTATTSSAPVVPSQPLTRPNIASANWTDAAGYTYRAVFYQGIHNELMINIWHSATLAWRKVNISSLLEPQTSNTQYWYDPPIAGTSLATCVSPLPSGFQLNLYYLSGEGQNKNLRELVTNDITGSTWHLGALSFAPAPLASGSSRIAAYWQTCANCSNILIVLYETPDTSLRANYWTGTGYWTLLGEVRSHIKEGSGLSIAPIVTSAYLADTGTDPMSIKVYYEGSTGIRELIYNKGRWLDGSGGVSIGGGSPSSSPVFLCSTSFGRNGWTNVIVAALSSGGFLTAHWHNGQVWASKKPSLINGPTANFSAAAINMDMRAYLMDGDRIYEFVIDYTDPFQWTFVSILP